MCTTAQYICPQLYKSSVVLMYNKYNAAIMLCLRVIIYDNGYCWSFSAEWPYLCDVAQVAVIDEVYLANCGNIQNCERRKILTTLSYCRPICVEWVTFDGQFWSLVSFSSQLGFVQYFFSHSSKLKENLVTSTLLLPIKNWQPLTTACQNPTLP